MCSILPKYNLPVLAGCLLCGSSNFKKNGKYLRKPHIGESKTLYPVLIQRFYCYDCQHTFSVLPDWLPPRRWYIWNFQEQVLLAFIWATTIRKISKLYNVARSTVSRWLNRLQAQFNHHADQVKQLLPNILGLTNTFTGFWKDCLSKYSLAQVMCYLSKTGLEIP